MRGGVLVLRDMTARRWIRNYHVRRVCVRVFWRGYDCPQWPYFSTRYTIASFGAGPIGVMLMHIMTDAEIDAFNAASIARSAPSFREPLR